MRGRGKLLGSRWCGKSAVSSPSCEAGAVRKSSAHGGAGKVLCALLCVCAEGGVREKIINRVCPPYVRGSSKWRGENKKNRVRSPPYLRVRPPPSRAGSDAGRGVFAHGGAGKVLCAPLCARAKWCEGLWCPLLRGVEFLCGGFGGGVKKRCCKTGGDMV